MKKFLISIFFIVIIIVSYLIYSEYSFDPLDTKDIQMLTPQNDVMLNKECSYDFIGMSSHGEYFDIYKYSSENFTIDNNYIIVSEWANKSITESVEVGKWKKYPIDSNTNELFDFVFNTKTVDDIDCWKDFKEELINTNNYYSYIYFNDLEHYFFLYNQQSDNLYYIRKKGF